MKFIFENIKCCSVFLIAILLSVNTDVSATECGVMRLQQSRSIGVAVKGNRCEKLPSLSVGATIELSENGRVWLLSSQGSSSGSGFQMICQNETNNTLQLEFSEFMPPWLNVSKLNRCTGWVNNKLSCEEKNEGRNGLYCVLAFNLPATSKQSGRIERTTSVKMRGLNISLQSPDTSAHMDKTQVLAAIEPDLVLCKQLNQVTTNIKVSWRVGVDSHVKQMIVNPAGQNQHHFSACAKNVIETFQYPEFSDVTAFELNV